MVEQYPSYSVDEVRAFATIRNLAESVFLYWLKEVDRKAEKWDDWQRHVNSGAQSFGED